MLASIHILFYAICFDILTNYWYVKLTYVNVIFNKLVRIKIGANTVPILKYKYEDFFAQNFFCLLPHILLITRVSNKIDIILRACIVNEDIISNSLYFLIFQLTLVLTINFFKFALFANTCPTSILENI